MDLIMVLYTKMESRGALEPIDEDWDSVRDFFEERRVRSSQPSSWGAWRGWSFELDNVRVTLLPESRLTSDVARSGPNVIANHAPLPYA